MQENLALRRPDGQRGGRRVDACWLLELRAQARAERDGLACRHRKEKARLVGHDARAVAEAREAHGRVVEDVIVAVGGAIVPAGRHHLTTVGGAVGGAKRRERCVERGGGQRKAGAGGAGASVGAVRIPRYQSRDRALGKGWKGRRSRERQTAPRNPVRADGLRPHVGPTRRRAECRRPPGAYRAARVGRPGNSLHRGHPKRLGRRPRRADWRARRASQSAATRAALRRRPTPPSPPRALEEARARRGRR